MKQNAKTEEVRKFLGDIYNSDQKGRVNMNSFSAGEIKEMAHNLKGGVPMATPVFDGAPEAEIKRLLEIGESAGSRSDNTVQRPHR